MNKQSEVIGYLSNVKEANLDSIYKNVRFGYYHNYKKHLSVLMSRMVKNGKVVRVRKGVFKLNPNHFRNLKTSQQESINQTFLF